MSLDFTPDPLEEAQQQFDDLAHLQDAVEERVGICKRLKEEGKDGQPRPATESEQDLIDRGNLAAAAIAVLVAHLVTLRQVHERLSRRKRRSSPDYQKLFTEERAFHILRQNYDRRCLRVVRRHLKRFGLQGESCDVVEQAFAKLYYCAGRYDFSQGADFWPFFKTLTLNTARDERRRQLGDGSDRDQTALEEPPATRRRPRKVGTPETLLMNLPAPEEQPPDDSVPNRWEFVHNPHAVLENQDLADVLAQQDETSRSIVYDRYLRGDPMSASEIADSKRYGDQEMDECLVNRTLHQMRVAARQSPALQAQSLNSLLAQLRSETAARYSETDRHLIAPLLDRCADLLAQCLGSPKRGEAMFQALERSLGLLTERKTRTVGVHDFAAYLNERLLDAQMHHFFPQLTEVFRTETADFRRAATTQPVELRCQIHAELAALCEESRGFDPGPTTRPATALAEVGRDLVRLRRKLPSLTPPVVLRRLRLLRCKLQLHHASPNLHRAAGDAAGEIGSSLSVRSDWPAEEVATARQTLVRLQTVLANGCDGRTAVRAGEQFLAIGGELDDPGWPVEKLHAALEEVEAQFSPRG